MKITQQLIEQGQSGAGGWNREQLAVLGIPWPPRHGWRQRIDGRDISVEDAEHFLALKGMTLARAKRLNRKYGRLSSLLLNFDAD